MTERSRTDSEAAIVPGKENEFELLCALSGASLSRERIAEIASWNPSTIDWNELLRLAQYHGVLPLAARNVIKHGCGLPSEIENTLRSGYEANLRRSLWFSAELLRITQHFEDLLLRTVSYKGPVLAQSVYGDPGLRSFSDLDFLITPGEFARAKEALADLGYGPSEDQALAVEQLWLRVGYERSFDGAAGKNLVELQWALTPYFYAVDFPVEDLLARAVRTAIGDREVACLAPEDCVLVLCLHAAKHLWTRLIWLSDIAETSRLEPIDWSLVVARARVLGIARILGVSFWLVKNVLRTNLPPAVEVMIAGDGRVQALGAEFAARLARGVSYDFESTEYFRLILKLREKRGDCLRYLWRLVWTPGAGDVAVMRLPEALFPFYRLIRLVRLAWKVVLLAERRV